MRHYPIANVPRGKRRRKLVTDIAYQRATFEIEYDGVRIEPLDLAWARRTAFRIDEAAGVSEAMVPEIRARTDRWKRDILEFETPGDRERRERRNAQIREFAAGG